MLCIEFSWVVHHTRSCYAQPYYALISVGSSTIHVVVTINHIMHWFRLDSPPYTWSLPSTIEYTPKCSLSIPGRPPYPWSLPLFTTIMQLSISHKQATPVIRVANIYTTNTTSTLIIVVVLILSSCWNILLTLSISNTTNASRHIIYSCCHQISPQDLQ